MSTDNLESGLSQSAADEQEAHLVEAEQEERDRKKRRLLLFLLLLLLLLLTCVCGLFVRYLQQPKPLPDMLPVAGGLVNYPPHYLFSIYGVDGPVGVALSPQGDRLYVAETGGERLIKMFNRNGDPQGAFAPPGTTPAQRSPVYIATDSAGRVFVTDRLQHAVFVYGRDGAYIDTLLGPDLTLSEYVAKHAGGLPSGSVFSFNLMRSDVHYQKPGEEEKTLPAPDAVDWSPLGISIDQAGNVLLTDVVQDRDAIREIQAAAIMASSWLDFNPLPIRFGAPGQGDGQFLFPNDAVRDSQGRLYIVDGNNGRISMWEGSYAFLLNFGKGSGDGALSLPRGADVDARDRLHVVDAVGQNVKVYDVSGPQPSFLFAFGEMGLGDGQFNYPNDIALDATGRLYIADRENNRIQVWSY